MTVLTHTSTLSAMSTTVAVISVGIRERYHRQAMEQIGREVEEWEQRFSRFRAGSMLSGVNDAAGRWVPVDREFLGLLDTARNAVFATNGRFNPGILHALEAHGYDRTIGVVRNTRHSIPAVVETLNGESTWKNVEIDRAGMRVRLSEDMHIDFGGIAKGALADRLANRFRQWPGGAISIGGDMSVWGRPPDGESWRVGIEHPLDSQRDITSVDLSGDRSAIATTSRTKRAWKLSEGEAHHLIDPFTGAPVMSPLLAVTVCAPTAEAAEVVTKNLMVASAHGPICTEFLLDAHWALTISTDLELTRVSREAA